MPDITKVLPNGNVAVIREDGSHLEIDPQGNVINQPAGKSFFQLSPSNMGTTALESAKVGLSDIGQNVGEFGKGVLRGATFGTLGQTESQKLGLQDSVAQPEKEKTFGKAGEFIGQFVPLAASEMFAGAVMPAIASKLGSLSPLKSVITKGALTGGIFEATKGAAENKPVSETVSDVGKSATLFGGLGAVGRGLEVGKEFLGKNLPKDIADLYVSAPKKIREALFDKQTSGGQLLLNYKSLPSSDRETVVREIQKRLDEYNYVSDSVVSNLKDSAELTKTAGQESISPFFVNKTDFGRKEVFNNVLDDMITDAQKFEKNKDILGFLKKAKTQDTLQIDEADKLRQIIDKDVNNAYLRENVSGITDAKEEVANYLRNKVSQASPELSKIHNTQYELLLLYRSLKPLAADTGVKHIDIGLMNRALDLIGGTAGGLKTARGLESVFGKNYPSSSAVGLGSEFLGKSAQLGVSSDNKSLRERIGIK